MNHMLSRKTDPAWGMEISLIKPQSQIKNPGFTAAMLAMAILSSPIKGAENSFDSPSSNTLEHIGGEFLPQKSPERVKKDFIKAYPHVYAFLFNQIPEDPTFLNLEESIFDTTNNIINDANSFKISLEYEILYRNKTHKSESIALISGIKQIQKDIQALEDIQRVFLRTKGERTPSSLFISPEINKKYLQSLEEATQRYNTVYGTEEESTEWQKKLHQERKEAGYTEEEFMKQINQWVEEKDKEKENPYKRPVYNNKAHEESIHYA